MKKSVGIFLLVFLFLNPLFAQRINPADKLFLQQKEDSLKLPAVKIILGNTDLDRLKADSIFTRMLMRALVVKNSFYYPFDSLESISHLYAPDSSFRIITWQLVIDANVVRQHGVIQMRTDDGSLKRFPLIAKSNIIRNLADTISSNWGWIGAVYYKIIEKKNADKNIYTLLGYDENNIRSDRKIVEILSFDNDQPVFGGRYFSFENDSISRPPISRYIMEFKKDAGPRLTYDADLDIIIFEHLISESNEPNKKWTLVGDGDYEGFKWKNGKWVHVEKVYHYVTPLGKEPVPNPVRNADGTIDESKLKGGEVDDSNKKTQPVAPKKKVKGN